MTDVIALLRYPFIVNALVTGSAVAVAAAASGYFMVCRRATFAGHALPNIGFAGAAGAVLMGIEPVLGLFAITILAAIAMGVLARDLRDRDVTVGVIMTFALGLGFLFLALYSGYAQRVYGILFGSILGISVQAARMTWRPRPRHRSPAWPSFTGLSCSALSIPSSPWRAGCPCPFFPSSSWWSLLSSLPWPSR